MFTKIFQPTLVKFDRESIKMDPCLRRDDKSKDLRRDENKASENDVFPSSSFPRKRESRFCGSTLSDYVLTRMRQIVTFLALFLISLASLSAKEPNAYPELRKKIHIYLNGVHALVGDFHQHNPDGTMYKGKVWLKRYKDRMGKMRLDYDPSVGQQIIALEDTLTIFDQDGNENTYNIDYTPAAFILRSNISFENDLSVIDIQKAPDGKHALITLTRNGDEDGPSLTLIFSLTNNGGIARLAMWEVIDMQGNKTAIEIIEDTERVNDMRLVEDKIFKATRMPK